MREHIIINKDRTVSVPTSVTKIGNRFEHNVNKVTFDCPRYADDEQTIDLSSMKIYINYIRSDKKPLSSLAENVTVDEADPTIMHFDFRITRTVTLVDGVLDCLVCIKSTNSEGVEEHHWNSDIFSKLTVGKGMENEETIAEENIDLITQLLVNLDTTNAEVSDVSYRIDSVDRKVGSLETLSTEDKSSIVSAVNEVKEDSDDLKGDLVELQEAVFDTETDYVEVTDVITLSNRGLTKISDTSFTIENSTHNIIGCSVTEGEKIKIICSTYNFYLGFGYVWATTEDTPELWNSSNAIGMLSSNEHDYFCGNTEEQWKTYTLELTVPSGAKKIWVRRMVETPHIYKMTPVRTSKIPTKTSQLENDSGFIVYTPVQRVPVVCFNFDQTTLDDRYVILKEHGFTATFGDADETSTKTLIKNGFDICTYLGNHTLSNISDEAIQTLTNSIAEKKSRLESWGVYNPVMCLCSGHKWTYALEQALINNNYNTFHYVRCATQYDSNDIVTYTPANASPSDRFQYPIPIEQFTVEQIKSIIDDFIEKKNPLIMLMMHIFTDDGGSNISKSQFIEIVEYVKTLSDNGTVKVMNMRQYYEYYYPEQAREDDRTRIFSALTN